MAGKLNRISRQKSGASTASSSSSGNSSIEDGSMIGIDIDYKHPLIESRPNFAKALKDFEAFLEATLDDLSKKKLVLEDQKRLVKHRTDIKTYLKCQIFLLQKHQKRLRGFQTEILMRVNSILLNSSPYANQVETEVSFGKVVTSEDKDKYLEDNVNAILKVNNEEVVEPSPKTRKKATSPTPPKENQPPMQTSPSKVAQGQADEQFLRLLADMGKMKTRCKHILDVTDRYCVLQEVDAGTGVEGHSEADFIDTDVVDTSCDSSHSSEGSTSGTYSPPPKIPGNVIKTTVTSVTSHIAVIAKTYTKRHSSEPVNAAV